MQDKNIPPSGVWGTGITTSTFWPRVGGVPQRVGVEGQKEAQRPAIAHSSMYPFILTFSRKVMRIINGNFTYFYPWGDKGLANRWCLTFQNKEHQVSQKKEQGNSVKGSGAESISNISFAHCPGIQRNFAISLKTRCLLAWPGQQGAHRVPWDKVNGSESGSLLKKNNTCPSLQTLETWGAVSIEVSSPPYFLQCIFDIHSWKGKHHCREPLCTKMGAGGLWVIRKWNHCKEGSDKETEKHCFWLRDGLQGRGGCFVLAQKLSVIHISQGCRCSKGRNGPFPHWALDDGFSCARNTMPSKHRGSLFAERVFGEQVASDYRGKLREEDDDTRDGLVVTKRLSAYVQIVFSYYPSCAQLM